MIIPSQNNWYTPVNAEKGPPDPFFEISFIVPDNIEARINYSRIIAEEFTKIGIGVDFQIIDLGEWYSRVLQNPTLPYPTYDEGGFDASFIGSTHGIDWQFANMAGFGANDLTPANGHPRDLVGYQNQKYLELVEAFRNEIDDAQRQVLFEQIQQILFNELPVIGVLANQKASFVYESLTIDPDILNLIELGRYTGWKDIDLSVIDNYTLSMFLPNSVMPLGPMTSLQQFGQSLITNMIFQPLYDRDPEDIFEWKPILAQEMPLWDYANNRVIVSLRDDIKFSDGTPMTSLDVVETYQFFLNETNPLVKFSSIFGKANWEDLIEIIQIGDIVALDETTIEFSFSYAPYLMDIFRLPILPSHIYSQFNKHPSSSEINIENLIIDDLQVNGFSELLIGSGEFTVSSYNNSNGEITVELERIENHWMAGYSEIKKIVISHPTFEGVTNYQEAGDFLSGTQYIERTNLNELNLTLGSSSALYLQTNYPVSMDEFSTKFPQVNQILYNDYIIQVFAPNQNHPIIGTELDTPLGKNSPTDATKAAIEVRYAMSHVIDRERISNEIYGGNAKPITIPVYSAFKGYNVSLQPQEYNLELAREHMEKAGYEFNPLYPNILEKTIDFLRDNPLVPISMLVLAVVTGFAVSKFTTFKVRNVFKKRDISQVEADEYLEKAKKIVDKES